MSLTPLRRRLAMERLETRAVPALYTVLNNADAGPGSLRAILGGSLANGDVIDFDESFFASSQTISLTTGQLPAISTAVTIRPTGASAGHVTIAGAATDIGAYEYPFPAPTAKATIGVGNQRSMIQSLVISFSQPVSISGNAFAVKRLAASTLANPAPYAGLDAPVTIVIAPAGSSSSYTITFTDPVFAPQVGAAKSLIDGKYSVMLHAAEITSTSTGQQLDGNSDGTSGDNFIQNFHRLFGDADGDEMVDLADFTAFRTAIGSSNFSGAYNPAFDISSDGHIDLGDFVVFRRQLGLSP